MDYLLKKVKEINVVPLTLFNKLNTLVILLALAEGLTVGCAGVENVNLSGDEVNGYRNLTPDQAYVLIQESEPLILDVRTLWEYERIHLESAVLLPLGKLVTEIDELREKFTDRNIVVYCQSGNRSETAAKLLVENGFSRIFNVRGGLKAWSVNNYPVVISNSTAE
ncbi:MAG: rhodanese-like domain-containing protein [Candidatus Neomarinimicrobiota bacterium]